MREIRVLVVCLIIVLLAVLSQSNEAFWWFTKVNWPAAWQNPEQGLDNDTTACLWAIIHGAASAVIGVIIGGEIRKSSSSEVEWTVSLLISFMGGAVIAALGDITSGWWWMVEQGRYIHFAWVAFLQSFLLMFMAALMLLPVSDPIQKSR